MIKVYTWPDCPNCEKLKSWLRDHNIEFDIQSFTTAVQTDFIMNNIFGSPPILETSQGVLIGEELFKKHDLQEESVRRLIVDNP